MLHAIICVFRLSIDTCFIQLSVYCTCNYYKRVSYNSKCVRCDRIYLSCSSSGFYVWVRLVYWSLRCMATFVISFHGSLLLAFPLHYSSSPAFLRYVFTQSSHLSCGLPPLPFSDLSSHNPPILAVVFLPCLSQISLHTILPS